MGKFDNFLFFTCISILFLCILLTFSFFTPKKASDSENMVFIGKLDDKEIKEKTLSLIKPGDVILTKPKSLYDYYQYNKKVKGYSRNGFSNLFFYNLFDKILISSMGDTYWHTGIYIGDGIIDSLYLRNIEETFDNTIEHKYFKVLGVKTSDKNKYLAMERAKEHYRNQDVYYSLKNGLIIVFLESTGANWNLDIREDELVCSSYVALLYREINFDDKPFTYITPVNIEFSDLTETKFLVNETGFYMKK